MNGFERVFITNGTMVQPQEAVFVSNIDDLRARSDFAARRE
jgi:hypothetical protein